MRIRLDTKFQLKVAILIIWTKFIQNRYFWTKTAKVNTIIGFYIFELVYNQVQNISEQSRFTPSPNSNVAFALN